jgi:hypothetical protein
MRLIVLWRTVHFFKVTLFNSDTYLMWIHKLHTRLRAVDASRHKFHSGRSIYLWDILTYKWILVLWLPLCYAVHYLVKNVIIEVEDRLLCVSLLVIELL